jgi:2-methylcitrate dehydratase PrpD
MMTNINVKVEERLAFFVSEMDYNQLPKEAIEISKKSLFDYIGVALAGSLTETSQIVLKIIRQIGGEPQAAVIGSGFRTGITTAALANGTMAHALDYDDVSDSWLGHPSVVLVSTILAMGDLYGSSGRDILTAYIVGFEVGAALGRAIGEKVYDSGWHNTATIGTLAGTAAAAKIARLDTNQTRNALGIAVSLASGVRQNFGNMVKPFHAGNAARNSVLAVLLAKDGFDATDRGITGEWGFCKVFGAGVQPELEEVSKDLGHNFDIISTGIWIKAYPSCGMTHSPIEAALQIKRENQFKPKDIVEIECGVGEVLPRILIHHQPKTGLEGKFSLEYCVAVGLAEGEVSLLQFTDEKVLSSIIQDLVAKVKYFHPQGLENKTDLNLPVTITVKLSDNRVFSSTVETPKGKPKNPMDEGDLWLKFENCAQDVLEMKKRKKVRDLVFGIEDIASIRDLANIIMI